MFYSNPPPPSGPKLIEHYKRVALDGAVFSAALKNQQYGISKEFRESWSVSSLSWSAGGEELYEFRGGRSIRIKPSGFISIGQYDRYSYRAIGDAPFLSNMVCFPRWITRSARVGMLEKQKTDNNCLKTKLLLPSAKTKSILARLFLGSRLSSENIESIQEKLTLLHISLIADQSAAGKALSVTKEATRLELKRRVERARQFILENYAHEKLNLQTIANEACLSRYHLIRVFSAITGQTPTQFLAAVRMEAAMSLLQKTQMSVACVAGKVGYRNRASFFKAFRKFFGAAPSSIERSSSSHYL